MRCNADPDMEKAECSILIDSSMTGIGLGPMLMRYIIDYARKRGIKELYGEVLRESEPMLRLNRARSTTRSRPRRTTLRGVVHVSPAAGLSGRRVAAANCSGRRALRQITSATMAGPSSRIA